MTGRVLNVRRSKRDWSLHFDFTDQFHLCLLALFFCLCLFPYVSGDTILYLIDCFIVLVIPLCHTTCCYILPENAIL